MDGQTFPVIIYPRKGQTTNSYKWTKNQINQVNLGPDTYEESGLQPPCRSVEKIEYSFVEHELSDSIWSGTGHVWLDLTFTGQRFREITQIR